MAVTSTEGRVVVFHTAALTPKTTRSTQGVNVMTLKPKYKVADARPLADTTIVNAAATGPAPCPSRACCSGRRTGPRSR